MYGIDFAYNAINLNLQSCLNNEIKFIARYYSSVSSKNLTLSEAQRYSNAGINILSVFEDGATDAYGGANQATVDAQIALKCAQSVNQPVGSTIFFAVDANDSFSQINNIVEYFKTLKVLLSQYTIGFYGSWQTAEYLRQNNIVDFTWCVQTWTSGFSGSFEPDLIQMVENLPIQPNLGIPYDLDESQDDIDINNFTWNYNTKPNPNANIDNVIGNVIQAGESTAIPIPVGVNNVTVNFQPQNNGASLTVWGLNINNTNRSEVFTNMKYGTVYTFKLATNETGVSVQNTSALPIAYTVQWE